MMLKIESYEAVRDLMRPGDVIAFGGKAELSQIIKRVTNSPVSHVGIIRHSQLKTEAGDVEGEGRYFNEIVESTSLDDRVGVMTSRLSCRLIAYKGDVWWLRLDAKSRSAFDERAYFDWLYAQEGKPYDMIGAAMSLLEAFPVLRRAVVEDFSAMFCSELAAGALEAGGVLPAGTNASGVTPIELCRLAIYAPKLIQLKPQKGDPIEIPRWNSVPAESLVA
jgi:hypothetical protein